MSALDEVLKDVVAERARQDAKWGSQRHLPDLLWHAILSEEVGECAKAILERDRENLRTELIQVAAVAVATVEAIDTAKAAKAAAA
jgi:NTP pyrophosphatase (non-canonical NTP hydrolase)